MIHLDEKLICLLEWIKNTQDEKLQPSTHSYISPKIEVRDVKSSGRGIYTNDKLIKSELILRIPPSFLLNTTTVLCHLAKYNNSIPIAGNIYTPFETLHDEFTMKIYEKLSHKELSELSSFQLLSLYITIEKQRLDKSFWKPFLNMLPTLSDFEMMPLVWKVIHNNDKLINLLPKSTQIAAEKVYTRFINDYKIVSDLVQSKCDTDPDNLVPKESFLLSWICINSRCLYMSLPTSKSTSDNFTMAPYVDFLNHSCENHCTLKIDGKGFQVLTTTAYDHDEQVYLSYGPHSNDFLLCEYGFVIGNDENKWNDLDISEYLIRLMKPTQIEFLKEYDYYGDYTMTKDGISFRTEVALAVVQERIPKESRRLMGLINGITDGNAYKTHSSLLLKAILDKVIVEAENHKYLEFNDDSDLMNRERKKAIGVLYNDRLFVAKNVLQSLEI
ncbi:uncharacterized protein J8A68_000079 [[Candida] subhashii]|uniref:SET domain-containing protein n=1 Tax=[Candida] subhashii TaxID=561895 RepID=A0A8J5QUP3_9ASCO|nr:uncharacterized protein J8A68_000079 [[Candida] subhashii]KAG7666383.1 hypothetical protein J8A68_000079 [[Candida] subhashii]